MARRIPDDRGTDERQAQRMALVGHPTDPLAEYPLGVLLARGIIDREMHDAGVRYSKAVRGMGFRAGLRQVTGGRDLPERVSEGINADWNRGVAALARAGRSAKDAVENCCVFERLPGWLMRIVEGHNPRFSDERERLALCQGLMALANA